MAERKIAYETINQKNGSGFLVKAPSLQRLYIDAALSLTDKFVSLDLIQDTIRASISVSAKTREVLMVDWLNGILSLFKNQGFLCKRIVFNQFDGEKIVATIYGDTYISTRHGHVSNINTVTCQQLQFSELAHPDLQFVAKIFTH